MKGEWTKVLVFGIIFLILGFLLGRITGHKGPRMHKGMHGENVWIEKGGETMMFKGGDGEHTVIIKELSDSSFEGDTTISIDGGEIKIIKNGDEMEVEVEMSEEIMQEGDGKEIKVIKKVIK
ncbi:MAG: hypothetical protein HKN39_08295 [Flavobacteriales bacterium]|nr:hypothetical protein [Flavobacteriales bacterium]